MRATALLLCLLGCQPSGAPPQGRAPEPTPLRQDAATSTPPKRLENRATFTPTPITPPTRPKLSPEMEAARVRAHAPDRAAIYQAQANQPLHPHLHALELGRLKIHDTKIVDQAFSVGMRDGAPAPGASEIELRALTARRGEDLEQHLIGRARAMGCAAPATPFEGDGCALPGVGRLTIEIERPHDRPTAIRYTITGWAAVPLADPAALLSAPVHGLEVPMCAAKGYRYGRYTFNKPGARFGGVEHLSIWMDCPDAARVDAALRADRLSLGWAPSPKDPRVLRAPGANRMTLTTRRPQGHPRALIIHHQTQEAAR